MYRHGGRYIAFCTALAAGGIVDHTKSRLVTGLNRSYTGVMCDDADRVWFTAPAANTQSRIGNVLDACLPLGPKKGELAWFDFEPRGRRNRPRMVVKARESLKAEPRTLVDSALPPHLFEYLMRVADGSLPGSFSRQCYEELRSFRLRVTAALAREDALDPEALEIVELGGDGRLEANELNLVGAN